MRPRNSNDSTWESSPGQEHTRSHIGSIGSAVPEDVRKRKRGERRRRRRRRTEGGGASTASQEAGGRVAMQMGSIHIANHWSLSALQRKSLFRQNSRNWSYVPQPWFLSKPLPTFPLQPVWTFMSSKRKKECRTGWIYFCFYFYHVIPSDSTCSTTPSLFSSFTFLWSLLW